METDQQALVDRVLVVDVPVELQLERTVQRDNNSANQVKSIISAQSTREYKQQKADDIILNIGTIEELQKDVFALHQRYLQSL